MSTADDPRATRRAKAAISPVDHDHVKEAYSRWAPVYDAVFGLANRAGRNAAVRAINRLPPGRVLEAGVGTGITLPDYDRRHRVFGIDLSPEMLARARRRVERRRLGNVEALVEMDAGELQFPDASFDAVAAMYLITVVPDPDRVMSEFVRVIKPGGRLVLINHFGSERGWTARAERWLSRFSDRLGWRPNFPIDVVTGRPDLRLVERRVVPPFALFTLLVFDRP